MTLSDFELVVRFASRALEEAIGARRTIDAAEDPAPALVDRCSRSSRQRLANGGEAAAARTLLDGLLSLEEERPLGRVERGLELDALERDVLRIVLAHAIEPAIGLLFTHLADDVGKDRPTASTLGWLLDPIALAPALSASGRLRRLAILHGHEDRLALDDRLLSFIITGELPPFEAESARFELLFDRPLPQEAHRAAKAAIGREVVLLRGANGSGRKTTSLAIARAEERPVLLLRAEGRSAAAFDAADRDARILGARVVVEGAFDERDLLRLSAPIAVLLEPSTPIPFGLLDREIALIELTTPSAADRRRLFASATGRPEDDVEIARASQRYAFTPGQIQRAALQGDRSLDDACRLQLQSRLHGVSEHRPRSISWERIVLPPPALDSLRAMCAQVEHKSVVDDAWGFADHHRLGRGVKALFHGPSGTGKTLAAEIIAAALGLPLHRVDSSKIVSKWIGESEKNLAQLFDHLEQIPSVLVFDEADSLFGRRTAIQDATDRYANMEVNYLLQRVDEYEGVVVLTTNIKSNVDEAFLRRLHHVIEFPAPDAAARERIWRISFPKKAPLGPDLDFRLLADRFELTGGAIKNIVTKAAYLAAAAGSAIGMEQVGRALVRELEKMDRLYHRAEIDALMTPIH